MKTSPLLPLSESEKIRFAILEVLEKGDQDHQPWAFYAHGYDGLKGFDWSKEQAVVERFHFTEAVIKKIKEDFSE